jgi:polar amino acid transport system permease protein
MGVLAKFDWHTFFDYVFSPDKQFWFALLTTVGIAVVAQFLGTILGTFSALSALSKFKPLRALSYLYVLVIRGTPVLVQIFFVYAGLPILLGIDLFPRNGWFGIRLPQEILAGTLALTINEGAYMSEIIRAGITAVDRGQMEAAKSLGMTRGLAMRRIVLPQAARVIVPPLGNEFNNMLKTTALLFLISVHELFSDAEIRYSATFQPAEFFIGVALWYLLLTTIWSLIQSRLERHLGRSDLDERLEGEGFFGRMLGLQSKGLRGA